MKPYSNNGLMNLTAHVNEQGWFDMFVQLLNNTVWFWPECLTNCWLVGAIRPLHSTEYGARATATPFRFCHVRYRPILKIVMASVWHRRCFELRDQAASAPIKRVNRSRPNSDSVNVGLVFIRTQEQIKRNMLAFS